MVELDETDMRIIEVLRNDSRKKSVQIARELNLSVNTVYSRIKKLEREGVIKRYTVKLDYEKMGKEIIAYIFIRVSQTSMSGRRITQHEIANRIKEIGEEIRNVSIISGPYDILVKVRARNIKELNDVVVGKIRSIDGVEKTQTTIVLQEIESG